MRITVAFSNDGKQGLPEYEPRDKWFFHLADTYMGPYDHVEEAQAAIAELATLHGVEVN